MQFSRRAEAFRDFKRVLFCILFVYACLAVKREEMCPGGKDVVCVKAVLVLG